MDTATALCRMLHFMSALWLFGIAVFQAVLATPAASAIIGRRLHALAAATVWMAAFTGMAWLGLEAGNMGEGWPDTVNPWTWWAVLADTEFGHVWIAHLVLGLVLILVLGLGRPAPPWASLLATALFLGTLGAVGHPAGAPWPATAGNVVHLLASGFWVGGFIPVLLCLRAAWNDPKLHGEAMTILSRFSIGGHVAVAAVLVTGIINIVYVLGRWPTNLSSPYDLLLLAKIALVAAMICLALLNRYSAMPRMERGDRQGVRALGGMTAAELALSLGVIALVSVFGMLSPM